MRNLGAPGRRGNVRARSTSVLCRVRLVEGVAPTHACPLKSLYLVMYKQGGGLGAVDSTGGCKADAVPLRGGGGLAP